MGLPMPEELSDILDSAETQIANGVRLLILAVGPARAGDVAAQWCRDHAAYEAGKARS